MTSLKFIPGIGCNNPDLMIIGEAPGEQEEIEGKPFVGRSGKLLDKWLKEFGIIRSKTYITNVIKIRPDNNRKPSFEEILSWRPLLIEEIKEVNPDLVITLGLTAAKALHNKEDISMSDIRGIIHSSPDFKCLDHINTFHPSYIMHKSSLQEEVFKDFEAAIDYITEYSLYD